MVETAIQGTRKKGRRGIYASYDAWEDAGKPDGWIVDHRTGKGRPMTEDERIARRLSAYRTNRLFGRDPRYLREKLSRLKTEAAGL
jgi:hypothetical protein